MPSHTHHHACLLLPQNGLCVREAGVGHHTETITALVWISEKAGFLSGSMDRKVVLWVNIVDYTSCFDDTH